MVQNERRSVQCLVRTKSHSRAHYLLYLIFHTVQTTLYSKVHFYLRRAALSLDIHFIKGMVHMITMLTSTAHIDIGEYNKTLKSYEPSTFTPF